MNLDVFPRAIPQVAASLYIRFYRFSEYLVLGRAYKYFAGFVNHQIPFIIL